MLHLGANTQLTRTCLDPPLAFPGSANHVLVSSRRELQEEQEVMSQRRTHRNNVDLEKGAGLSSKEFGPRSPFSPPLVRLEDSRATRLERDISGLG